MKRVFIIHGWEGFPEEGWFPWLKRELEAKGFYVEVPQMPDAANPRIFNWVPKIAEVVGTPDEQTYFVGHSMGCQAIARYIESLPDSIKVGGAVFVAGFFKRLSGAEDEPETLEIRNHWLETPINFDKVRACLKNSVAIFSDNDPWVPLDNQEDFRDKLDSYIRIVHGMGHFSGPTDNITTLPIVLEEVMRMSEVRHRVSGVVFKDGKILIIHRIKMGQEYYTFPGGGVEKTDESPESAMIRELKEELSLETKIDKLMFKIFSPGREDSYFLVKDFDGQPMIGEGPEKQRMGPDNQYLFEWKTFDELVNLKSLFPDPDGDIKRKIINFLSHENQSSGN